jgi:anti-sigma-K factor RskA
MSEHDALRDAAGAWVLGALDEDEAWGFSAHLEVCASCRDEVARLRVAVETLPLAAPPAPPPPELKTRLMAIVEAEARRAHAAEGRGSVAGERDRPPRRSAALLGWLSGLTTRPALAAGLATLLLVVGAGVGFAVRGGGDETLSARVIPMTVDGAKARGARAQIVQTGSGVEVRVSGMPAPPRGRVYQVWLQRGGRAPEPDAVVTVDREGRGAVAVLGRAEGVDNLLVTDEPLGGSSVPSRRPVLLGRLA